MSRPVTRTVDRRQVPALRRAFEARGHALRTNPKNRYIAFEVRTEGRSIFTLYTSGKLVCTVREGDAEGLVLADELDGLLGAAAPVPAESPSSGRRGGVLARGTRPGLRWLAGVDETGTGELLGAALLGGALLPGSLADALDAAAGHVETKTSRAASGWQRLSERLLGLSAEGLILSLLPLPNRLFDRYSKNGLLDLAYVRLVADLLAGAGLAEAPSLGDVEIVVDDYRVGALLRRAAAAWEARGACVRIETRADDGHLAARAASVLARAARSREMEGLAAEAEDGPVGTGNPGHPATRAWLRRRARSGRAWPSFVKTSFRTVRDLDGLPPVEKVPVPPLAELVDEASGAALLEGRSDGAAPRLACGDGTFTDSLVVDHGGRLLEPAGASVAHDLLPVLCGGLVLDAPDLSLERLDRLLDRETGLLSGWRVLVGPTRDLDDPAWLALARAHRAGRVHLAPTAEADAGRRAAVHGAARLVERDEGTGLRLVLADGRRRARP